MKVRTGFRRLSVGSNSAFAALLSAYLNLHSPVRLSVRTQETTIEGINIFLCNFLLQNLKKNCRAILVFAYIGQL